MEEKSFLKSRKNEGRSLMKRCFKNPILSLVPFEIWRDLIVSSADLKAITFLSQTCFAFKEVVDVIGENNFNLALLFRKECQIVLARKYLFKCAKNNNSLPMYHVGYAYRNLGWGLKIDHKKAIEWLQKSAELGSGAAMIYYAYCLKNGYGAESNVELSDCWGQKALSSNNLCGVGLSYLWGIGTEKDRVKARSTFLASAERGDEFSQYFLANLIYVERDLEKAFEWYLKSAEQGLFQAIFIVSRRYRDGNGCIPNEEIAEMWSRKGQRQRVLDLE